jgi:hypothetical protein
VGRIVSGAVGTRLWPKRARCVRTRVAAERGYGFSTRVVGLRPRTATRLNKALQPTGPRSRSDKREAARCGPRG